MKDKAAGGKSEYMTSLSGSRMVSKSHERIAFRGLIDTLEAEVIEAQVLAAGLGDAELRGSLGEVLEYLRAVMAAEVKETSLPPPFLFGLDAEELRRQTHGGAAVLGFPLPLPAYTQGPLAARINYLRAKIREAELCAVRAFGPGENSGADEAERREDIIMAMNRLSSALWWLFCKHLDSFKKRPARN